MIKNNPLVWITAIIAVVFILVSIALTFMTSFNDTDFLVTVTDKDRIVTTTEEGTTSKYLVYTKDSTGAVYVFENTDTLLRGKFNSSDIQAQLEEGKTYIVTVVGWRVPFLSWYQNILKVTEVV